MTPRPTKDEFHAYLVKLAMEAFDGINYPTSTLRDAFESRVRERMAQAASVYALDTDLASETKRDLATRVAHATSHLMGGAGHSHECACVPARSHEACDCGGDAEHENALARIADAALAPATPRTRGNPVEPCEVAADDLEPAVGDVVQP